MTFEKWILFMSMMGWSQEDIESYWLWMRTGVL